MSALATIFYEDARARQSKNFAPHRLILACVKDRLAERERHIELRDLEELTVDIVMKGDGNLLSALRQDASDLSVRGPVYALFDRDRIHILLKISARADTICRPRIVREIVGHPPIVPERNIVLLEQNMETVINACCEALQRPVFENKPNPQERDDAINPVVWGTIQQRNAVLSRVPSFARIVGFLAAWCEEQLSGNHG
jgi:hypothetical protein